MKIQTNNELINFKKIFKEISEKYLENKKDATKLLNQVIRKYSSQDRHYHNLKHLFFMINAWKINKHLLKDPDAIFYAIIYHDIIYKPKRKDNESKSADFFNERVSTVLNLNFSLESRLKVARAILASRHNELSKTFFSKDDDIDIQMFMDFDIEILGTNAIDYEWYRLGVRNEYIMYPDEIYKAGRKSILDSFLKRKEIFLTPSYKNLEKKARKNLHNEIKLYLC